MRATSSISKGGGGIYKLTSDPTETSFTCVVGYLKTISVASDGRTTDELERIWKEVSTAYWGTIVRSAWRSCGKPRNPCQNNSRCPGRDSSRAPPEYKSRALPLDQPVRLQLCWSLWGIQDILSTILVLRRLDFESFPKIREGAAAWLSPLPPPVVLLRIRDPP
jgi:hypothetical protein